MIFQPSVFLRFIRLSIIRLFNFKPLPAVPEMQHASERSPGLSMCQHEIVFQSLRLSCWCEGAGHKGTKTRSRTNAWWNDLCAFVVKPYFHLPAAGMAKICFYKRIGNKRIVQNRIGLRCVNKNVWYDETERTKLADFITPSIVANYESPL